MDGLPARASRPSLPPRRRRRRCGDGSRRSRVGLESAPGLTRLTRAVPSAAGAAALWGALEPQDGKLVANSGGGKCVGDRVGCVGKRIRRSRYDIMRLVRMAPRVVCPRRRARAARVHKKWYLSLSTPPPRAAAAARLDSSAQISAAGTLPPPMEPSRNAAVVAYSHSELGGIGEGGGPCPPSCGLRRAGAPGRERVGGARRGASAHAEPSAAAHAEGRRRSSRCAPPAPSYK